MQTAKRRLEQNDTCIGDICAIVDHVARELLTEGKIGDGKQVCYRRKMPRWTGKLKEILPCEKLREVLLNA